MGYRKQRKTKKVIVLRPVGFLDNSNASVKIHVSSETPYTWFGKPVQWNGMMFAFNKNMEYAFLKKKWKKVS